MRALVLGVLAAAVLKTASDVPAQAPPPDEPSSGCLVCHEGIEPIRETGSRMLAEILALGTERGDPAGCVVCHGGDVTTQDQASAHRGRAFYPDPGSPTSG